MAMLLQRFDFNAERKGSHQPVHRLYHGPDDAGPVDFGTAAGLRNRLNLCGNGRQEQARPTTIPMPGSWAIRHS